MSLSFLFLVPMVRWDGAMSRFVRWTFRAGFSVPIVASAIVAIGHGFDRQDRFEVIIISINWLVLIINGSLLTLILRRLASTDTS